MTLNIEPPLSNIQMELLKLYSNGISDESLQELKIIIARFLMEKARIKINEVSQERGYNQETLENLLNSDEQ